MDFKYPLHFGILQSPLDPLGPGTPGSSLGSAIDLCALFYFFAQGRGAHPPQHHS